MSVQEKGSVRLFYVHYIDCEYITIFLPRFHKTTVRRNNNFSFLHDSVNKRLDDWVLEDFLDTRKIQFPRKDGTQAGTGLSTPKKLGASGTTGSSRPSSPLAASSASDLTVNGSALLAAALQKRNGRKRKIGSVGKEETTSLAALPPAKKIISMI